MPHYYFELRTSDGQVIPDDLGVAVADKAAATREAEEAARSFARDRRLGGYDYSSWYFEIRTESG
jgi:hypothetical protein